VLFLQNPPFNNVFLMIILVWIQTGFAMVILSAAIKSVPSEYVEAAKVDGATESQTFFNIVLPTILPTIGVVATTLIVLVTKVFDIVKVTTNGNFGTNVLANDFFSERFNNFDNGLGSAIATIILLMVLPVMILNVRRMQQARND
jgi:alpha-glucoside transport system permease protein